MSRLIARIEEDLGLTDEEAANVILAILTAVLVMVALWAGLALMYALVPA